MLLSLALVSLLTATVTAAANDFSVTTEVCLTKLRPGTTTPVSLPTCTKTSAYTTTSIWTELSAAATSTTTLTPDTVTWTEYIDTLETGRSSHWSTTTAFVTVSAARCVGTKTISAPALSTVYTGTYEKPITKRFAPAPPHEPGENDRNRRWVGKPIQRLRIGHFNGTQQPYEVDCIVKITTYVISTTTVAGDPTTQTVTAEAPTTTVTAPREVFVTAVSTLYSTVTDPSVSGHLPNLPANICYVTTGTPLPATTQHIKCAPSNVIGAANGKGIDSVNPVPGIEQRLTKGYDPSACCQLCVDTEGCVAMYNGPQAGNCLLFETKAETCGQAFSFSGSEKWPADGRGWVQSGCGTIELVD